MNLNSKFENPFSKKNEKEETLNESFTQPEDFEEKEEETTLEQDIATIEEKKMEMEKLKNELEAYRNSAFQLKEKIVGLGLTDTKRQELYQKITDRSKEIAAAIREIKDEYGIEPTEIEVLSSRFANLTSKIDQLRDNLQLELKDLHKHLEELQKMVSVGSIDHIFSIVRDSLERKFGNLPIAKDMIETMSSMNANDSESLTDLLDEYAQKVKEEYTKLSPYEAPGEEKAALEKLERLEYLTDVTELRLKKALEDPDSFR